MRQLKHLGADQGGAVAPTVALSLIGLIAVGGLAFDYAHLAALDTELQQAADQAALAAVTQLDGNANARVRATAAAKQVISNWGLLANDGTNRALSVFGVTYCSSFDDNTDDSEITPSATPAGCTVATSDADAKFAVVSMNTRRANYALTPIVKIGQSPLMSARAAATVGSAICKVPPVMLCNPDEPVGNADEMLDYNPARGTGLRLITGDATVPGNFGWLNAGLGNGAQSLASALGYNNPPGPCQAITGVTTQTGMETSVLNALNTRFDIYANGNTTCPNQLGGTCSPSVNTRKDLICEPNNTNTACKNNNSWSPVTYDPPNTGNVPAALPTDGTKDPQIMGYPHDICQSGKRGTQSACAIAGDGVWDINAYFRVNYGLNETGWRALLGVGSTAYVSRYDVYKWEITNPNGTGTKGKNFPQSATGGYAFSYPANGYTGVAEGPGQADRRTIAAAVLNCRALNLHGKSTNVPVPTWIKLFLVEPTLKRGSGNSANLYSEDKEVYVEFVEKSKAQDNTFEQVVRRDVPVLLK